MNRYLALLVVVILAAGVFLFEEQHRAATFKHHVENHIPPPASEAPRLALPPMVWENNFADYADLWGNPRGKNPGIDMQYSSLAPQNELAAPVAEKILAKPEVITEPVITVHDREADYAIFSTGGFKLNLNLKPVYSTQEGLLPNHIDPSIGGSFNF
jgi:hypothetical protein